MRVDGMWAKMTMSVAMSVMMTLPTSTADAANPALTEAGRLFQATLDNGMEVLVLPDRRSPSVVHMVWYDVGAVDEELGKSGVAHLFEHMMFKGTKEVPAGEFNRRIAALGGRDNAFTGRDYTAYFQQIPPAALAEVMKLEADRMVNLTFAPEEFAKEREVVIEERKLRTDDVPEALGYEALMATTFFAHPYRNPIIGWPTDLARVTLDDVKAWYQRWYAPNNARLIVVGDVVPEEVLRLAQQHYGAIPARPIPKVRERTIFEEPPQHGERHVTVYGETKLASVMLAWKVPPVRDPAQDREAAALLLLSSVLDGSDAARLPRRLVRETHQAVKVSAYADVMGRGPGMFTLSASATPGTTLETLTESLLAEIARIAQEGVSETELQRAKRQFKAHQVYERDSLMGQAMQLGMARAVGLPADAEDQLIALVETVGAAEVQRAAQTWFSRPQMTRVDVLPRTQKQGNAP